MTLSNRQKAGIGSGAIILIIVIICIICCCCSLSCLSLFSYGSGTSTDDSNDNNDNNEDTNEDVSSDETIDDSTTDPNNEYGDTVTDPAEKEKAAQKEKENNDKNDNNNDKKTAIAILYSNNELTKISGYIEKAGEKKFNKIDVRGIKIDKGYVLRLYGKDGKRLDIDTTKKKNVDEFTEQTIFKKDVDVYKGYVYKK